MIGRMYQWQLKRHNANDIVLGHTPKKRDKGEHDDNIKRDHSWGVVLVKEGWGLGSDILP